MGHDARDTAKYYLASNFDEEDSGGHGENQDEGWQMGGFVFDIHVSWDDFGISWYGLCGCAQGHCRMGPYICTAGICGHYGCLRPADQEMQYEVAGNLRAGSEHGGRHDFCSANHTAYSVTMEM